MGVDICRLRLRVLVVLRYVRFLFFMLSAVRHTVFKLEYMSNKG